MSDENVELLRGIYGRWAQGDFGAEAGFWEDMTLALGPEFPDSGEHSGRAGIAAYMGGFLEPWRRLTIEAEEMTDAGDSVLVRVLQSGTGKSSGIDVELRYFHLWRFDGERPTRIESIMDEGAARTALEAD